MEFIIPTMWRKSLFTINVLKYYVSLDEITKIIIIDNDIGRRPKSEVFDSNKIKIIDYGKNLYVNESWNRGMENAGEDLICICNDDIRVDKLAISLISEFESLNPNAIDLIGVSNDISTKCFGICPFKFDITKNIGLQAGGLFGIAMFIRRKNYKKIPKDLKVWFGDDYLARSCKNIYTISPIKITGGMSATVSSIRKEAGNIDDIIEQDKLNWRNKYMKKNFFSDNF